MKQRILQGTYWMDKEGEHQSCNLSIRLRSYTMELLYVRGIANGLVGHKTRLLPSRDQSFTNLSPIFEFHPNLSILIGGWSNVHYLINIHKYVKYITNTVLYPWLLIIPQIHCVDSDSTLFVVSLSRSPASG